MTMLQIIISYNYIISMQKNGKSISWTHLYNLYVRDQGDGVCTRMLPKLKYEHLHLTSFSKMRVDLAAQVIIKQL